MSHQIEAFITSWFSDYETIPTSYAQVHQRSVEEPESFWRAIRKFFDIRFFEADSMGILTRIHPTQTRWFVGAKVSYTHEVFKHFSQNEPVIYFQNNQGQSCSISWGQLLAKTVYFQKRFHALGLKLGDRVAAYALSRPETIAAFFAANSMGLIWASCPPEFGYKAVFDRFQEIEPKLLLAHRSYTYRGKNFDKSEEVKSLSQALKSLTYCVYLDEESHFTDQMQEIHQLHITPVDFNHPIWILFSSGTTGIPKAITHGTGAMILEHCKALGLHQDVRENDRYFWYSTTGWMMFNYSLSSLLLGAKLCLYEGDSTYPCSDELWEFASTYNINHFGHGSVYFQKIVEEIPSHFNAKKQPHLKSIAATGSVLQAEVARKLQDIFPNIPIISLSGGTDVCSAFLGGLPGYHAQPGELACKMLGANVQVVDQEGRRIINEAGELILASSLLSMPLYFWNDPGNKRYRASYYEYFPGLWRHGDWAKELESGSFILYGRSDATLNRHGVRMGSSEIYEALLEIEGVADSLIIHLTKGQKDELLLFVQTKSPKPNLTERTSLTQIIKSQLKKELSPRHVPDKVYYIPEIPYTLSGKKVEIPIRRYLEGEPFEKIISRDSLKNPSALDAFSPFINL